MTGSRSNNHFLRGALALTALALLATSAAAQDERHALSGSAVTIWNLAGRAELVPTTGSEVIVHVSRGGRDGDALTISATNEQFVVRYPDRDIVYRDGPGYRWETRITVQDDGTFSGGRDSWGSSVRIRSSGSGSEAHADLRIEVPKGRRVQVNVGVGVIDATNVDGDIELATRASPVTAREMKGRLRASTGSGRVTVERAEGNVRASTGSGSVELSDIRADEVRVSSGSGTISGRDVTTERFDASTGSGGMRLESVAADEIRATSGSGGLRIDLTKVPRSTTARSGSGRLELTLPSDANVDVDIRTGSGGISTEFPVTMESVRRRELRGRIGNGGSTLRLSTGSGGVRLRKR